MVGKRDGIISYLFRQNKGMGEKQDPLAGFKPTTYSMGQYYWRRKNSLDHSATDYYIKPEEATDFYISKHLDGT